MVLDPTKHAQAEAVFVKWGLDFAVVGKTTDTLRFEIFHEGILVANLPIKKLGDEAPEYDRPWTAPVAPKPLEVKGFDGDVAEGLLTMLAAPNGASRRWVYEQYDTLVRGQTLATPGGDAGLVRVDEAGKRLAFAADVNPRYVEADPFEGAKQAVAECWRNITSVGALPLACTDNLNFGNPERPEIMGGFVAAIKGLGEACKALDFPIVSGNVSLYNETNGVGILPTPAMAGVGLIEADGRHVGAGFVADKQAILLISGSKAWGDHMGQSSYLRDVLGREEGAPPPVDLIQEKKAGDLVRSLIQNGTATAVHDLSDGGLALALAEMAMNSGIGATIDSPDGNALIPTFFGEDQGRYLMTVPEEDDILSALRANAENLGLFAQCIGTTGGKELKLAGSRAISIDELRAEHEGWFPSFMQAANT